MPPNVYMGEGIGVASNSKGHIFVNTCAQQTRNFEFDQNGNYVREIGKDSYGNVFCHGIRVDAQDNIWVIDEGANSIIKYNPAGRAVMILGRRIGFPYTGMEPAVKEIESGAALYFQSPHRRRLRRGRQHLRRRRLRQFTHRQVRQERQASSSRSALADRGPASSPCCMPSPWMPRAMSTGAAAATSASWCSTTI